MNFPKFLILILLSCQGGSESQGPAHNYQVPIPLEIDSLESKNNQVHDWKMVESITDGSGVEFIGFDSLAWFNKNQ